MCLSAEYASLSRMLKIRLQRVGRKNIPIFRVVLTDSKNSAKSGKFLEILGIFDTVKNVKKIDAERVKYWMSKGAIPSDTIHNFLIDQKIISGKKINVLPLQKPTKKRKELKVSGKGGKVLKEKVAENENKTETLREEVKKEE